MRLIEDGVAAETQTVAHDHATLPHPLADALGASDDTTGACTAADVVTVTNCGANGSTDDRACDDTGCC